MRVVDFITAPGSVLEGGMKTGGGDDRYAFDEAAGWAAVIDGATDVGPVRIYPSAESDAARFAELFARVLVDQGPQPSETPQAYFARIAKTLGEKAKAESRIPFKDVPLASYPTAAATWVRARNGKLEAATLGDSVAIVRTPAGAVSVLGEPGKPAEEQGRARKVMAMTPEQRLQWLRDVRAIHNKDNGYWVFGVQPEAAAKIVHQTTDAPPGTRALVMTDGFYRLVSPYARYTDAELIAKASEQGLGALLSELRGLESNAADDAKIGRFKTSDDATALLLEI